MQCVDLLVSCPFNISHSIYENRMQSHLVKCERSQQAEKLVCPFNAIHRTDFDNYIVHLDTCNSRRIIERQRYEVQDKVAFNPLPYVEPVLPPAEDNWDDDPPSVPYDPQQYAESASVLRKPAGVTKSERKAFYLRERERHNRIKSLETGEASAREFGACGEASTSKTSSYDKALSGTMQMKTLDEKALSNETAKIAQHEEAPSDKPQMMMICYGGSSFKTSQNVIHPSMGMGRGKVTNYCKRGPCSSVIVKNMGCTK